MIQAIAIDLDPAALKQLEQYCGKVDFVDLRRTFQRPSDALAWLDEHGADLLFLRPEALAGDGVAFFAKLPEGTQLVITTNGPAEGAAAFPRVADVLAGPFRFERFARALTRASEALAAAEQHLFVKADYRLFRLPLEEIVYIEGLDDYLKIRLDRGKPIVARMTMKTILEQLPPQEFIRVHRSYIVPVRRIGRSDARTVTVNGHALPVGASYRAEVARLLNGMPLSSSDG